MRVFICLEIGENMKKIIKVLTIIMTFFIMNNTCYAIKAKVEEIPNIRIHINTSNINETRKIYHITNEENSSFYSIELNNKDYSFYYDDYDYYGSMNDLNTELKNKIGLITYFGYGYQNRTDIKWYIVTQYMIWEELIKEENGEIYFVDIDDNKIDLYQKEMQTIIKDIEAFNILPSFLESDVLESQYNVKLTESLTFEDKNNILKEYDIIHSNDISHKIENNKITINPLNINTVIIIFRRKTNESEYMKIHINSGHRLISRGDIDKPNTIMTINIPWPTIKIKGNIENNFSNHDNLYTIYLEDGSEYYKNISLNSDGSSEEISLYPGKYYLGQTKVSYGYKLNQEKIEFEVSKEDQIIEFKNELETKHVTIEKIIIDNEEIIPASGNKLKIYSDDNKLIKEITTNSEGKSFIDLPYGTYTIIENDLLRESQKVYTITIDENYNEKESFIIKEEISNNELDEELSNDNNKLEVELPKGNIIINKYDYLTNKPLSGIKIALFNQDKKLIKEEVTNNEGKVIFKDIETGTYYLKEILNDNYDLEDALKIEVKENIDTIITSNNRTMIEVPNTLATNPNINIVLSIIFITSGSYLSLKKSKNEEI